MLKELLKERKPETNILKRKFKLYGQPWKTNKLRIEKNETEINKLYEERKKKYWILDDPKYGFDKLTISDLYSSSSSSSENSPSTSVLKEFVDF